MKKKQLIADRQTLQDEIAALQAENQALRLKLSQFPEMLPETPAADDLEEEAPARSHQFSRFPILRGVDEQNEATHELDPAREPGEQITLRLLASHLRFYAGAHFGIYAKRELYASLLGAMAASDVIVLHDEEELASKFATTDLGTSRDVEKPAEKLELPGWKPLKLAQAAAAAWGQKAEPIAVRREWKRGDLLGMPDAVTRLYRETRLLRIIYEAHYQPEPCITILEDLTAALPEEYLATLWPILLRGPGPARSVQLMNEEWPGDPLLLRNGALPYPENLWLFGTIVPGQPALPPAMHMVPMHIYFSGHLAEKRFDMIMPAALHVRGNQLRDLFAQALPLPEENLRQFEQTVQFLADHLNVTADTYALRQMTRFTAVFHACGLTPADALDSFFFHKAMRCLEAADPALVRYEMPALRRFLVELFGKKALPLTLAWLEGLEKEKVE